jgi:hypothetical protein
MRSLPRTSLKGGKRPVANGTDDLDHTVSASKRRALRTSRVVSPPSIAARIAGTTRSTSTGSNGSRFESHRQYQDEQLGRQALSGATWAKHGTVDGFAVRAELVNGAPEIGGVPWQISFGTA